MFQFQAHKSELDESINYTLPFEGSLVECRFVQRDPNQIIAYVSSQNGCNKACRFCHLTQTGQTSMNNVPHYLFAEQLRQILGDNERQIHPNVRLNVNFMARGEPLANPFIVNDWPGIAELLLGVAEDFGIDRSAVKLNISSIIPNDLKGLAADVFQGNENTWLYWSYYSHQMAFRKRWIPRASSIIRCLEFIGDYPRVVVHSAFIKDENDQIKNLKDMLIAHPHWRVNIVRYNPFSWKQGEEATNIEQILKELEPYTEAQIVPRVGFDVAASCGMFLTEK